MLARFGILQRLISNDGPWYSSRGFKDITHVGTFIKSHAGQFTYKAFRFRLAKKKSQNGKSICKAWRIPTWVYWYIGTRRFVDWNIQKSCWVGICTQSFQPLRTNLNQSSSAATQFKNRHLSDKTKNGKDCKKHNLPWQHKLQSVSNHQMQKGSPWQLKICWHPEVIQRPQRRRPGATDVTL